MKMPSMIISPKFARLAGLGAFGAIAGLTLLFLLIAYVSRHTLTGGMRWDLAWVTWISLAVLFGALIGAHVVVGKQLLRLGHGDGPTEL